MQNSSTQEEPLIDMLTQYARQGIVPFHMPGHKMGRAMRSFPASWDITEIPGASNLKSTRVAIAEAEAATAKIYGTARTFFLVQGSTLGVQTMVMSMVGEGKKVLMGRNAHQSGFNGCIISGALPRYVLPRYDSQADQCLCITPEDVAQALEKEPDIEAVYVTYPTYDGLCCNLKAIADIAHAKGVKVLVDGAHSAHFNFSEYMPPDPGACGADVWVQSAHKTLPALTQSAFLHVAKQEHVDRVARVLDILQTTSPSYLLMASLDRAKSLMFEEGRQRIAHMITLVNELKKKVTQVEGVWVYDEKMIGRSGIAHVDPLRLVVDVSALMTGYALDRRLRQEYNIQVEMSDSKRIICIISGFEKASDIKALSHGIYEITSQLTKQDKTSFSFPLTLPEVVYSPRQAFLMPYEVLPLEQCADKVAAQSVRLYPPGIPCVCPGERMTEKMIDQLKTARELGAIILGLQGNQVKVLK